MACSDLSTENAQLKRALKLDGLKDVVPVKIDPDNYTESMVGFQPYK